MRFWLKKLVMPFSRYIAHEFISSPRVSQANFIPGGLSTKTMTRRLGRCGQQSRQGVKFLSTRTCLQKWQQTYSKIGGDLCWFLWLWIWLGETLENFLLWAFIFWNIWGETFFMPSVEKIKWVCNVPREAIKKERNLEFDLSLLSLWKSACQNDKGTPGDFGGTLTARKNDLPVKHFDLNLLWISQIYFEYDSWREVAPLFRHFSLPPSYILEKSFKLAKLWLKGAWTSLILTTENMRSYVRNLQSCIPHQDQVNLHFWAYA